MKLKLIWGILAAIATLGTAHAAVQFGPVFDSDSAGYNPLNVGTTTVTQEGSGLRFNIAFNGTDTAPNQELDSAHIGMVQLNFAGLTSAGVPNNGAGWVVSDISGGISGRTNLDTGRANGAGDHFSIDFDLDIDTDYGNGGGGVERFSAGESLSFLLTRTGFALPEASLQNVGFHLQTIDFTGSASGPSGETSAWYYTSPIPEPHEWAMMLAGLAAVGAIAKRKRQLTAT